VISGELVLKSTSVAIFSLFTIFAAIVVVKEISKPDDPLLKIIDEHCIKTASTTELSGSEKVDFVKFGSEERFFNSDFDCLFIDSSLKKRNYFTERIFKRGAIQKSDYLFLGAKGVLLKKFNRDLKPWADLIFKCYKMSECSYNAKEDPKFTVTFEFLDSNGKSVASNTFADTNISQILRNGKELIKNILTIRNKTIDSLLLNLQFHKNYALIENKDKKNINSLVKYRRDGLYLKSRGAKIRMLPRETRLDPHKKIGQKGKQYGLKKDEIDKKHSSLYIFRTEQFLEKDGKMEQFTGMFYLDKREYSNELVMEFLPRFIMKSQKKNGSFEEIIKIANGKPAGKKRHLLSQLLIAESLLSYGEKRKDQQALKAVQRALDYVSPKMENRDTDFLITIFYSLLLNYSRVTNSEKYSETMTLLKEKIDAVVNVSKYEYIGIVLDSILDIYSETSDEKWLLKFDKLSNKCLNYISKTKLPAATKLKIYSYLLSPLSRKESETGKKLLNSAMIFFEQHIQPETSFPEFSGGFFKTREPDIVNTALFARGVSLFLKNRPENIFMKNARYKMSSFIKYHIVTSDDIEKWDSPKTKEKVLGGVRYNTKSRNIYTAATAQSLVFFTYQ